MHYFEMKKIYLKNFSGRGTTPSPGLYPLGRGTPLLTPNPLVTPRHCFCDKSNTGTTPAISAAAELLDC